MAYNKCKHKKKDVNFNDQLKKVQKEVQKGIKKRASEVKEALL